MNKSFASIAIAACFQLLHISSFGQNENYKVTYRHCLEIDTTRMLIDTIGREAILTGNKKVSAYTFAKLPKEYKTPVIETTNIENLAQENSPGQITYVVGNGKKFDSFGNILYFDKQTDSLFTREKMMNDYVILKEKRPGIKWNITNERKIVGEYECYKVTCTFRGRNYIVWFTKDAGIIDGPWKFKGLPGLIMSLEDDRQQLKIYVSKVELRTSETVSSFVESGIPVSLKKYLGFRDEEMHEQMRSMQMNTPATTKIGLYGIERSDD